LLRYVIVQDAHIPIGNIHDASAVHSSSKKGFKTPATMSLLTNKSLMLTHNVIVIAVADAVVAAASLSLIVPPPERSAEGKPEGKSRDNVKDYFPSTYSRGRRSIVVVAGEVCSSRRCQHHNPSSTRPAEYPPRRRAAFAWCRRVCVCVCVRNFNAPRFLLDFDAAVTSQALSPLEYRVQGIEIP
jgi:hypothetical protein